MNHLTIHFHMKHYKESGLPFIEYMLLLVYENNEKYTVDQLSSILSLSNRTLTRLRGNLVNQGFLKKINNKGYYSLTDKLYQNS